MVGYLEDSHLNLGQRMKEIIARNILRMKMPGYFLLIINPNSKLNNKACRKHYAIIIHVLVFLETTSTYFKAHILEVTTIHNLVTHMNYHQGLCQDQNKLSSTLQGHNNSKSKKSKFLLLVLSNDY